ncbi:MAG TPA: tRNA (adenosine(37)-N6)-threonylcarbamoyltransferase complex transferase subunit TsaD [Candidatus Bipolaricaulota bacterium]|nr:tRNA (adenosine(37)-N6)-threonylcarbamoyltransferase complex transferase subunit TsaD [Candidatus Bipolaricaulota bacterium]
MKILAIETSCDETAASVVEIKNGKFAALSNTVSSQIKTHAKYGGVIPEVAGRLHIGKIIPVIDEALSSSKTKIAELKALAVVSGPGLAPSLRVGVETAKALAYVWQKPLISVNHLEGHIAAGLFENKKVAMPAVCLIASGGHTSLIYIKSWGGYETIGQTRDDAAGEAFDKVAKIMGLGYPGGPLISKLAENGKTGRFKLPRPMIDSGDFDFSFSGLKTAALYLYKSRKTWTKKDKADLAAEFQDAVIEVLVEKSMSAAEKLKAKSFILGGGVSANKKLRATLKRAGQDIKGLSVFIPPFEFTTDNAAMIGAAAYFHYKNKNFVDPFDLVAEPRWRLI